MTDPGASVPASTMRTHRSMLYDAIIVGGGAAGLSAALILARARRKVLVVDDARPRNAPVAHSHGFLTRDGIPPAEFIRLAHADLAKYPTIAFTGDTAVCANKDAERFGVQLTSGTTEYAKTLLLATGVFDQVPDIEGFAERWGHTIFVCPFCDGWEIQGQRVAVYGAARDAVELAQEIVGWTKDLIVCLEADDLTIDDRRWIRASGTELKAGRLTAIAGDAPANVLTFQDGSQEQCSALFLSAPLRQHSPLFAALGCEIGDDGLVKADEHFHTTVPGCFAAGDAVTLRHQIVIAAASGAAAAISLNCNLLEVEAQALIAREPVDSAD
jgi:thioredoxin reductase